MTPHEGPRISLPDPARSFRIGLFAPADRHDLLEGQFGCRGQVLGVDSGRERFADRVAELVACGFDEVYLHHVGQQQDAFLDAAGETLLPLLRSATATTDGGAA